MVPLLPLSRLSWPPSCWAKPSTSRPPSPESARRGSTPLPSSETVRRSFTGPRLRVTRRIGSLAVIGGGQAKLAGRPLQRHQDSALRVARKSIFEGIRHELVHHE